jgi:hypothetical protein
MFSALREAVKLPPVYTPAARWRQVSSEQGIERTTECGNALHAGWSVFAAGDSGTLRVSDNKQFGPGGAVYIDSQRDILVGATSTNLWVTGAAVASREISGCTGLAASRHVPGEFWLANDRGVSLLDENLRAVGCVVSNIAVDACSAGSHPRVALLSGETILRADLRQSTCEPLACARPQRYYAGWTTDWDGAAVYNWSALKANPRNDFVLAAVSQRYRSLVIFDLRKNCIPLAEWSLPTHPNETNLQVRSLEWDDWGRNLISFAAGSRYMYSVSVAGSYAPLFSDLQVTHHSNMILGACLPANDSSMLVLDSRQNLCCYFPAIDESENVSIATEGTDRRLTASIPCGEIIRKLLDHI